MAWYLIWWFANLEKYGHTWYRISLLRPGVIKTTCNRSKPPSSSVTNTNDHNTSRLKIELSPNGAISGSNLLSYQGHHLWHNENKARMQNVFTSKETNLAVCMNIYIKFDGDSGCIQITSKSLWRSCVSRDACTTAYGTDQLFSVRKKSEQHSQRTWTKLNLPTRHADADSYVYQPTSLPQICHDPWFGLVCVV